MCGLAGILRKGARWNDSAETLRSTIQRMTSTLRHRGPDGDGLFMDSNIALGHRRLSILEISELGSQPMEIRPGGAVIAYNGECYNFQSLRNELIDKGHDFRGHSDTEVILHAYTEWGMEGLKRLEGIFAISIWDPSRKRLVLMRDRLGVKPLYYAQSRNGLAFGSEIKAVLAAGEVETRLDEQAFSEYMWFGNTHEDRTFYSSVRALKPGHWLIVENGVQTIAAWWTIEKWLERSNAKIKLEDAAISVRDHLDKAVSRQLVADVPIGIFLSGGVDSSAIAASAMNVQKCPISSFSAGFDFERGTDELPKARQVAKKLGLQHNELRIQSSRLQQVLIELAIAHDEPFADAANIPLYLMCQELGGRVKVVLQGDGGDELFAGYRRYAVLRNSSWWRAMPPQLTKCLNLMGSPGKRLARMAESLGEMDDGMRMAMLLTMETRHAPPTSLLQKNYREHLDLTTDPFRAYRNAAHRFHAHDPVEQMLLTDLTVQLPAQFLIKVDRATMAAGIEARVPLLDEGIAEYAVGLPSKLKVNGTSKKIVLRESQRCRLPSSILDGPKTGFGVPYGYWLKTTLADFAHEQILDPGFLQEYSFDGNLVEKTMSDHCSNKIDRGFLLWKVFQMAIWHHHARTF